MAVVTEITCATCREIREVWHAASRPAPEICAECSLRAADARRAEHLAARAALSTEKRLALIEEWIYDYKPPVDPLSVRLG